MSQVVEILGWSAEGLRCPDHEISLKKPESKKPSPVTLIQMPNGTGKTTTLTMLRAVLSGEVERWAPKKVREFRRPGRGAESGSFLASLLVNDKRLTFDAEFDFEEGSVELKTTYGEGQRRGHHPPAEVKKFLAEQFVNLFIFDGEFAHNLLDSDMTRARDAVDALFQLWYLDRLRQRFEDNWLEYSKKVGSRGGKGLRKRRELIARLRGWIDSLRREKADLESRREPARRAMDAARERYEAALGNVKGVEDSYKGAQANLAAAEERVRRGYESAIRLMRDPQALSVVFAEDLVNLKVHMDRLKLPSTTSREFFEELAEDADVCICGRRLDAASRQEIRERAGMYLGEDDVGVLNSIKSDISASFGAGDIGLSSGDLSSAINQLAQVISVRDEVRGELGVLEDQMVSLGGSEVEGKQKAYNAAAEEFETIKQRLREINRSPSEDDEEDCDCLASLLKMKEAAEDELARATDTLTLKNKTKCVSAILEASMVSARAELCDRLAEESNKKLNELLPREPVAIRGIEDSLMLEGKSGASMGQTLTVGYAFLATLFNRSEHTLPFVVDSPAGPLDLVVRSQVAKLIPSLCKQFVAFMISSEREGFVAELDRASKGKVHYITMFRKTDKTSGLIDDVSLKLCTETDDGMLVTGSEFFGAFDLDTEEG